jgi:hypothetical protein
VISLPKVPYVHRKYLILVNPTYSIRAPPPKKHLAGPRAHAGSLLVHSSAFSIAHAQHVPLPPPKNTPQGLVFSDFLRMLKCGSEDSLDIYDQRRGSLGGGSSSIDRLNQMLHASVSASSLGDYSRHGGWLRTKRVAHLHTLPHAQACIHKHAHIYTHARTHT